MSDMDLVLLESVRRDAIVARVRVMWHRRIPVIDGLMAEVGDDRQLRQSQTARRGGG
jgi:hypothetical protein